MSKKDQLKGLLKATRKFVLDHQAIELRKQRQRDAEYQNVQQEFAKIEEFLNQAKIENLIAIHLTDYFPDNGIKRPASKGFLMRLRHKTTIKNILHEMET